MSHRGASIDSADRVPSAVFASPLIIRFALISTFLFGSFLAVVAVEAQTLATTTLPEQKFGFARLIEWDLEAFGDAEPGAMQVDTDGGDKSRVWFVTRVAAGSTDGQSEAAQRVYRFETRDSHMKGSARFTSWGLRPESLFVGGVKRLRTSRDRRFVFVRTFTSLQRIDTRGCDDYKKTCERVRWLNEPQDTPDVSDISVDDRLNVYTTHAVAPSSDANLSYVQRTPAATVKSITPVTRWRVGGGVGFCPTASASSPCVSGVAVHPSNRSLVYVSEPSGNNVSELNVDVKDEYDSYGQKVSNVRRWSLNELSARLTLETKTPTDIREPRQLHIDRRGRIWVVTGSGHLVSLDPRSNKMTAHAMPDADLNDPFGVAPDDDVVGYTASDPVLNKVGMLIPKGVAVVVNPARAFVPPEPGEVAAFVDEAPFQTGFASPVARIVQARTTSKQDGIFIEAFIHTNADGKPTADSPSMIPLGITPHKGKSQGTFFYAVGVSRAGVDRIGFARLPVKDRKRMKFPRDDDDPHDGDDQRHGDWCHNSEHGDDDADGMGDEHDTASHERATVSDPTPLAAGAISEHQVTTTTSTLALIVQAVADNLLAPVSVEIYDGLGLLKVAGTPTPGVGVATLALPTPGTYTVRVRNLATVPVNHTTTLIVREPWPVLPQ
jgi:hypothetical protein